MAARADLAPAGSDHQEEEEEDFHDSRSLASAPSWTSALPLDEASAALAAGLTEDQTTEASRAAALRAEHARLELAPQDAAAATAPHTPARAPPGALPVDASALLASIAAQQAALSEAVARLASAEAERARRARPSFAALVRGTGGNAQPRAYVVTISVRAPTIATLVLAFALWLVGLAGLWAQSTYSVTGSKGFMRYEWCLLWLELLSLLFMLYVALLQRPVWIRTAALLMMAMVTSVSVTHTNVALMDLDKMWTSFDSSSPLPGWGTVVTGEQLFAARAFVASILSWSLLNALAILLLCVATSAEEEQRKKKANVATRGEEPGAAGGGGDAPEGAADVEAPRVAPRVSE